MMGGAARSGFAPREVFEQILDYMPIATFDLVIEHGDRGVVFVRRRIAPYKDVWALPGLRMLKGEGIDDTLRRIARQEVGLEIDTTGKVILGQFVGRFRTERARQDISTGYLVRARGDQEVRPNAAHFHAARVAREPPGRMGAMYRFYWELYAALWEGRL